MRTPTRLQNGAQWPSTAAHTLACLQSLTCGLPARRERDRQAEVDRAQRRREAEDAVLAEALAEDHRRRGEELERRKRDADERLRAMEEQRRVQEEAAAAARQKAKGAKGEKKKG